MKDITVQVYTYNPSTFEPQSGGVLIDDLSITVCSNINLQIQVLTIDKVNKMQNVLNELFG